VKVCVVLPGILLATGEGAATMLALAAPVGNLPRSCGVTLTSMAVALPFPFVTLTTTVIAPPVFAIAGSALMLADNADGFWTRILADATGLVIIFPELALAPEAESVNVMLPVPVAV